MLNAKWVGPLALAIMVSVFALTTSKQVVAQATTDTSSQSVPLELTIFIPCSGETVAVTGELHILNHVTVNPDGSLHVVQHFNPQGVSGVSDAGNKFQGTGVTQEVFNINVGQTFTFVNNFRFIGQGPGNNSTIHQNVHTTVNANGDLTSTVDNFSADCS